MLHISKRCFGMIALIVIIVVILNGCIGQTSQSMKPSARDLYLEDKVVDLSGEGTIDTPYLIHDAKDFHQIKQNPTAHYQLANDIDFNLMPYKEELGVYYFGYDTVYIFTGSLDGNGHTIKYDGDIIRPIFMNLEDAVIKNLVINWNINNSKDAMEHFSLYGNIFDYGVLASLSKRSTIQNINFIVDIDINLLTKRYNIFTRSIGALVGTNSGLIEHVQGQSTVRFIGQNSSTWGAVVNVGGIAGQNRGHISNIKVFNIFNLDTSKDIHELRSGGIAGTNDGRIETVIVSSTINARSNRNSSGGKGASIAGGVCGVNTVGGIIYDVESIENVIKVYSSSFSLSAGLAGENNGAIRNTYSSGIYEATGNWASANSFPLTGSVFSLGSFAQVSSNIVYDDKLVKTPLYGIEGETKNNVIVTNDQDFIRFKTIVNQDIFFDSDSKWDTDSFLILFNEAFWIYSPINRQFSLILVGDFND